MTHVSGSILSAIETGVPWPTQETRVTFSSHELTLLPETDLAPSVVLDLTPQLDEDEAVRMVKRFLSALAWVSRQPVRELQTARRGGLAGIGKRVNGTTTDTFYEPYLPLPETAEGRLALALYRQALGLNDVGYECFGYFRIMNLVHKGKSFPAWLDTTVPALTDFYARERLPGVEAEAAKARLSVGGYLYVLRRSALAHANVDDPVNPDERNDTRRLAEQQPIIRALAEHVIETDLEIPSAREWRKQNSS